MSGAPQHRRKRARRAPATAAAAAAAAAADDDDDDDVRTNDDDVQCAADERSDEHDDERSSDDSDDDDGASSSSAAAALFDERRTYADLGLPAWLVRACSLMGFRRPTHVQSASVPAVLAGRQVLALARTGSGKTAAFALPLLAELFRNPYGVFAVVLTPTRELAAQIAEQFRALGATMRLRDCLCVGGVDMHTQARALAARPHVVVATPGRLLDHLRSSSIADGFRRLRYLVLDEADRTLRMPELPDIVRALAPSPGRAARFRPLLFSATLPSREQLAQLAPDVLPQLDVHSALFVDVNATSSSSTRSVSPTTSSSSSSSSSSPSSSSSSSSLSSSSSSSSLSSSSSSSSLSSSSSSSPSSSSSSPSSSPSSTSSSIDATFVATLKQQFMLTPPKVKEAYLVYLLRYYAHASVIVFCSTCRRCGVIAAMLAELRIDCLALHSWLPQRKRTFAVDEFRAQRCRVLVATDVASRGLDIPSVQLVVNFDMGHTVDDYVHRVGRTARIGRRGKAVSLLTPKDIERVYAIEQRTSATLREYGVKEDDVLAHLQEATNARKVAEVLLDEQGFGERERERRRRNSVKQL